MAELPQHLEREVLKDLEVSDELADGIQGGNRPLPTTAPTGTSAI